MALSLFDEVTQQLLNDPGLLRIKKLLVFTCHHIWESDSYRLSQYSLQDLIAALLAIAPTQEHLTLQLNRVVGTINKPAEYALVAQTLVNYLDPFYRPAVTDFGDVELSQIEVIVNQLTASPDPLRTRKLLYAACHHTWVNDPETLRQHSVESLVLTLHHAAPTPERLQAVLQSIVQTLNRQTEYSRIAQTIHQAFEPLYTNPQEPQTQIIASAPIDHRREDTQIVRSPDALGQLPVGIPASAPRPVASSQQATTSQESAQPLSSIHYSLDDLFDLRINLIKFTNPLRVKALVFSMVHAPVTHAHPIGAMLKEYELDDLLRSLFYRYPGFNLLEADSKRIVSTLPDAEHYAQANMALLRAIQPFYESGAGGLMLIAPAESGPVLSRGIPGGSPRGEREETCQFSTLHQQSVFPRHTDPSCDDLHTAPLIATQQS